MALLVPEFWFACNRSINNGNKRIFPCFGSLCIEYNENEPFHESINDDAAKFSGKLTLIEKNSKANF